MKHWTNEEVFHAIDVPDDVIAITSELDDEFSILSVMHPRLTKISKHNDDWDFNKYWISLEIEPGLTITTESGCLEYEDDSGVSDMDQAIADVIETLDACLPDSDRLADIVHDARVRARKVVGQWQAEGLPTRLIDVHLAPYDNWRGSREPSLLVLVEKLDEQLMPSNFEINLETEELLEASMAESRRALEPGYQRRTAMMALGASGTIDQLALNAIGTFFPHDFTLRRFANEWRFWLPDLTALLMTNGHVSAGSGTCDGKYDWYSESVAIMPDGFTDERLRAAVGRPITELLDHPFLSSEMVVTEAERLLDDGDPRVFVRFDQPQYLFCSATGRVWDFPTPEATPEVSEKAGSGPTVVPFPKRNA